MPVAAPISGVEVKLWPCSDSRSAASGVFRNAGSAEVVSVLRCEASHWLRVTQTCPIVVRRPADRPSMHASDSNPASDPEQVR